jgi:hypothetical protein
MLALFDQHEIYKNECLDQPVRFEDFQFVAPTNCSRETKSLFIKSLLS